MRTATVLRPRIAQVNLIADDVDALAAFYKALFRGADLPSVNPGSYAGVDIGQSTIGISARNVRDALNLQAGCADGRGTLADHSFFSVELSDPAAVDATAEQAVSLGATALDGPRMMPFGWHCVTLRDPESHVFRLYCDVN